jgi:hypothetical protein
MSDQLKRLEAGIKIAHQEGNEEMVRKLGAEYRRLQSSAQQSQKEPSFWDKAEAAVDGPLESVADTAEVLGFEGAEGWLRGLTDRPEGYKTYTEKFLKPGEEGFDLNAAPGAVAEQAPQFGATLASGWAGAKIGAKAGGFLGPKGAAVGGVLGGLVGAAAPEVLQVLGPTAKERAENDGRTEVTGGDIAAGAATAAASGALNALTPGVSGIGRRAVVEGVTESGQSVIQQTGGSIGTEEGWQVDPKMVVGEGLLGAGSAVTVDGAIRATDAMTPENAGDFFSRIDRGEMSEDDIRAADRLLKAADGDMAVLANVNDTDTGSAKAAANAALRGIRAEVGVIASDLRKLAKYQGSRDAEVALNALVKTTQTQSSSSPESFQQDVKMAYEALKSSGYSDADVERLKSLSNQINTIQRFTKGDKGDMGGLSAKTSRFDITDPRSTTSLGGIAVAASGSIGTAGTLIAVNRVARQIDRLTNNRSRVKRFVDSAKAQQKSVGPIQGETSRDTLAKLKLADQVAKANLKLQTAQGAAAARGQKSPGQPKTQSQGSTQVSPEELARRYRLEASNRSSIFETGKVPQNDDPMLQGDRLWEARIGKAGDEVVDALEQLEREGLAPQGAAQMYAEDIGGFSRTMKKNDIIALQEAVRQRINPEYQPQFDRKGKLKIGPEPDQVLKKFQAADKGLTSSRRKQRAIEGDRRYKNLLTDIEAATPSLDSTQLQMIMDLAESINSPAMTRADRFKLVDEMLPLIFPKRGQRAVVEAWRTKFIPLAAAGNDYAIEREADPVQAEKEKAFDEKLKEAKKPRKVRTRKAANDNQRPAADRPAETTAERALRKLRKPRDDGEGGVSVGSNPKDPKGPEPESPATEVRKAETPARKKRTKGEPSIVEVKKPKAAKGRTGLAQMVEERIEDIYESIDRASNDVEKLEAHRQGLTKSPEHRVEALIYDMATDRVTVNMLSDAYAELYSIPGPQAAQIVNNALNAMEDKGMLKRRMVRNNARLKYDGKFIKDPTDPSKPLMVVDLQFHNPNATKSDGLDPEFYERLQIAKAVKQVGKMVPQSGPDVEYGHNVTEDGDFRALKDIPRDRVTPAFRPIFNFLNAMRQTYHSIHPKMLDQIEKGLSGVNATKLGPIGDILRPKDKDGKRDDSNVRTVAQLLFQTREAGNTLIRQEWMAGANLRVYSRNGLAHSQAGDIMKGLMRSAQKDKLGGEAGLNYVFHGLGNLLGFDKKPPAERRMAIFEGTMVDDLIKLAEDPFGRLRLEDKSGNLTSVGKLVKGSEGFFQALNAAHEVKSMVDWARERHKDKSKLKPKELLQDPEVRADLAQNYETDFIVQLDASNNAYQIAGMVMGYTDVLQSTGMLPPEGASGDPDMRQGGDIYMQVAGPATMEIPELSDLDLPGSVLRKIFKKPVGTYLYAAAFNSRKKAFKDALSEIAGKDVPIFGVEENGLIPVPENIISEMDSQDGHLFVTPHFDADGEPSKPPMKRKRIVPSGDKFVIEVADGLTGKFVSNGTKFGSRADAVRSAYENYFYARMNQELIKQMNVQFPGMRQYLNFAQKVSDIVKAAGRETVKVPTKDGMMLEYSFKQNPIFEKAEIALGDGNVVPLGVRGTDTKMAGRGLAAFMTHQNDAWALRETHKRLQEQEPLNTFNPIHDSYGIHPKDAQRTQETWVQVMQELGAEDYNIFLSILEANQIPIQALGDPELIQFIMGRQGVQKVDPKQIPTALS